VVGAPLSLARAVLRVSSDPDRAVDVAVGDVVEVGPEEGVAVDIGATA